MVESWPWKSINQLLASRCPATSNPPTANLSWALGHVLRNILENDPIRLEILYDSLGPEFQFQ